MQIRNGFVSVLFIVASASPYAQAPPRKADVVMVAGCLREQPAGTWRVVNATDPKPSNVGAPPQNEMPSPPVAGTKQFQLIGVSVFDLPSYKDQTVVLKGLLIPATPVSRLNITSVTRVAPSCGAAK